MQEETIQNKNLRNITLPQIKNSQIYLLTTLSYFVQGMFNIMTIYYLTNYYDKYLGFSPRDIFLITLIAYFPLILKPFIGLYFNKKTIKNHQVKLLLAISSCVFFCTVILMSLITTKKQ